MVDSGSDPLPRLPPGLHLTLVAAMDRQRLIGARGTLPWHLPADLKHFRRITMGHPLLMGRRTHASIGRALDGRLNVVLTRDTDYRAPGCIVVDGLAAAFARAGAAAGPGGELMVIGGAALYRQTLPLARRLQLTRIDAEFEGDTWFPDFDEHGWREVWSEVHGASSGAGQQPGFRFQTLERA